MSGFNFDSIDEANVHQSLSYLVKNGGAFVSQKQAEFIYNKLTRAGTEVYSIPLAEGQHYVTVGYTTRWADYGSRSVIPGMFIFVVDGKGVVAKYKLPFNGNMRDGARPAPERITQVFARGNGEFVDFIAKSVEVAKKEAEASEFIGNIGEKTKFSGVIKSIMDFGIDYRFNYYGAPSRMTVVEVNGQDVVWWNAFPDAVVGDSVTFIATVKDHKLYKGKKQTVVTRPSKVVLAKKVEEVV